RVRNRTSNSTTTVPPVSAEVIEMHSAQNPATTTLPPPPQSPMPWPKSLPPTYDEFMADEAPKEDNTGNDHMALDRY
ncbi:unnamed protein product, partial [Didymodactylos carnosus]